MTPRQIESWAIRVIEQVEKKQNVEDILVELKREWPTDPNKTARQLGGHANAARGEAVLWLIGVDEGANKIIGASHSEFANWYPAVEKEFDAIAPRCIPLNVPHQDASVVALLIETDRAPFVVRNAVHGQSGGGPVSFEVPWRNGARTDSAKRVELFKLLTPVARLPEVDVLGEGLWASQAKDPSGRDAIVWRLDVFLFVAPRDDKPVVIAAHRCECSFVPSEFGLPLSLAGFTFGSDTPGNVQARSAVTINTPGLVTISAIYFHNHYSLPLTSKTVRVSGKVRPVGLEGAIDWSRELHRVSPERSDYVGVWGVGGFTSF